MSHPSTAIYDYIPGELAPADHEPDEAPIALVCEPPRMLDGSPARGAISMRRLAGTNPEKARTIASTLQAKVTGPCPLESSGTETT